MKILVAGGGGREHAIIKKLSECRENPELYAVPGNGGISKIAKCFSDIKATDIEKIIELTKQNKFDLVFVASDDPLALGLVDEIEKIGVRAFGPRKNAAEIEWSKVFSKNLMKKYNIPTAEYEAFDSFESAVNYVKSGIKFPIWIKSDGLALGKGAIRATNINQAYDILKHIMVDKTFGDSGNNVIIEEELVGQEITVLAFCDGKTIKPMVSSQDHKRAFDNDKGENTGGMGAFSPSRIYTEKIADECMKNIYIPTINAMRNEGRAYKGVIYFQLILTKNGVKVIEYNARFGDPEAQVVLPRLKTDFLDIINAVIDEKLDQIDIEWEDNAAVCVILASGGYPVKYEKGYEITGIEEVEKLDGFTVYHAGTATDENGKFKTSGGRVLGVTAVDKDLPSAIKKVYSEIDKISFKDMFYRKDIGVK
ncbi:MAG: phosphoribosylamine--glycine ligase [Oscillospiraceae bacterium]|nr:phosphoribosylamine--glycine ligase [Oscillospiraceae bacterium]